MSKNSITKRVRALVIAMVSVFAINYAISFTDSDNGRTGKRTPEIKNQKASIALTAPRETPRPGTPDN